MATSDSKTLASDFWQNNYLKAIAQRCSKKWRNSYGSRPGVFYKKDVLNIGIIRRKISNNLHLSLYILLKKEIPKHVSFLWILQKFQNISSIEHFPATANLLTSTFPRS